MLLPTMNSRKCTNILKSVLGMWESGMQGPDVNILELERS